MPYPEFCGVDYRFPALDLRAGRIVSHCEAIGLQVMAVSLLPQMRAQITIENLQGPHTMKQ